MKPNQVIAAMKKCQQNLIKERDKLRELRADVEALEEVTVRAYDVLIEAIDALSEQV